MSVLAYAVINQRTYNVTIATNSIGLVVFGSLQPNPLILDQSILFVRPTIYIVVNNLYNFNYLQAINHNVLASGHEPVN